MEEFKQYKNSPYDIYTDGRCFSHLSNKFLSPQMTNKYPTYNLTIDGKKKKTYVHRMVAETFLPAIEGKEIVNHKDGNTHNFDVSNLEWVDVKENSAHAVATGLRPKSDTSITYYEQDLEGEVWKNSPEFPMYAISNKGRVMNITNKRLKKPTPGNSGGYLEVNLWKDKVGHTKRIHYLVYSTFNNDFDLTGYVINHIDGNKHNNTLENLEKVTSQENNYHAEYIIKTHKCAKAVVQYDKDMNKLAEFPSIAEAQRQLNISNISRAIKKKSLAGGWYWQFKNND